MVPGPGFDSRFPAVVPITTTVAKRVAKRGFPRSRLEQVNEMTGWRVVCAPFGFVVPLERGGGRVGQFSRMNGKYWPSAHAWTLEEFAERGVYDYRVE